MQHVDTQARHYDAVTIAFHWATAFLVVALWLGAQTIDFFPRGPLRVDARSVHVAAGVLLVVLLAARLLWRLTAGRRLPPADTGPLRHVATATHYGLYALLAAMLSVGLFLTWARGDSIFNLFSIPAFRPGDRALADQVQDVHGIIGYLILGLAGLHAAAALLHRLVWRDGVLGRMLPGLQTPAAPDGRPIPARQR